MFNNFSIVNDMEPPRKKRRMSKSYPRNIVFIVKNARPTFEDGIDLSDANGFISYIMLCRSRNKKRDENGSKSDLHGYIEWEKQMSDTAIKSALSIIDGDLLTYHSVNSSEHDKYYEKFGSLSSTYIIVNGCRKGLKDHKNLTKKNNETHQKSSITSDLKSIQKKVNDGVSRDTFIRRFPVLYCKYKMYLDTYIDFCKRKKIEESCKAWRKSIIFNDKQKKLEELIQMKTDNREIIWFYDTTNEVDDLNTWARCKVIDGGTLYSTNIELRNVANAWDPYQHKLVIFNFTNTVGGINYTPIERIKNGIVDNTKYMVETRISVTSPTVIVLANFKRNKKKISETKWKQYIWSPHTLHEV